MNRRELAMAGLATMGLGLGACAADAQAPRQAGEALSAYDFTFEALEGGALPFSAYRGRALLVVNTASECGFTGQYSGLRLLDERFAGRPLTIIGVPSNDFGAQEPGSAEEIRALCDGYRITFPMAAKTHVVGPQRHPFYAWAETALGGAGVPRWNFHKILVDRTGRAHTGFPSQIDPISPPFVAAVAAALA